MDALPLRLSPGSDLRRALEERLRASGALAGFVAAGVGSLTGARLRFAGCEVAQLLAGDLEILTLSGTLSPDGAHLHMSVAAADGRVLGGHVGYDCTVRTTAEVLVVLLPGWSFRRTPDAATGHAELLIRRRGPH